MAKHILKFFTVILFFFTLPVIGFCQLPTAKWVNDIGGPGDSKATGMVTDKQNNIYVSGYFSGTVDFDPTAGVKNLTSVGGYDVYVAKYLPNGTLVWAISMGGDGLDQVNNMTVDANGNPTITGQYQSSVLHAGALSFNSVGAEDIFIVHMDTNGNILWGKSIGGPDTDRGEEVSADSQGSIFATAIFQSTITVGNNTLNATGGFNGLIVKYDVNGNLQWYINLGSSGDNEVFGNAVDGNGNIIVSGTYTGTVDFDPLGVHHNLTSNGLNNPFVAKYSPSGKLIWVNAVSGNLVFNGSVISVDGNNDVYFTGAFSSALVFNGATTLNTSGIQDTFLAKYSSGGIFQYANDIGGSGAMSFPYQIRNDQNNNVYITGYFSGTIDFNPAAGVANVSDHGQRDLFLGKYDSNGNYQWAFSGGNAGCSNTFGIELAIDNNNDIVLGGSFCQTVDFDPSTCITDNVTAQNGISDTYIAKYIQSNTVAGQIVALTIPQQTSAAVIDQVNHTVNITVSPGSNIKALTPSITVTNNAVISPGSGATEDFTSPVVYSLTSGCVSSTYTVKVTLAASQINTTCSGAVNILSGDVVNPSPISYDWQLLQGGAWVNAPGVITGKDYETSALVNNAGANVVYNLRRLVNITGGLIYDSFYDVTVQPATPITNNIITPPTIIAFCSSGDPGVILGNVPSGGGGNYGYQWQGSADNITFTNIAGATAKDFDPPTINTTTYFRRMATGGTCSPSALSNVLTIIINSPLSNNVVAQQAVTVFCTNGNPGIMIGNIPSGGDGSYFYQWQNSTDNVTFSDISGAISKDFDPPVITVTTYYRRLVTSAPCASALPSNTITITIFQPVTNNVTIPPQITNFCTSGDPALIIGSTPLGGNGIYNYQWQSSVDNITFADINGANAKDYDPPSISATTHYQRLASSGACTVPQKSNVVDIIISGIPTSPTATASPATICPGSSSTVSIVSPQNGITYDWYDTATKTTHLFTGASYITGPLNSGKTFYVEASNGACSSSVIGVPVTVTAIPTAPVVNNPSAICMGTAVTLNIISPQSGTVNNWYAAATGGNALFTGSSFITPVLAANTTYYVDAVNSAGCSSGARTSVNIVVNAVPVLMAEDDAVCPGSSAILTASSSNPNTMINWYASASGGSKLFTGNAFTTPALNTNTNYYAEASDNLSGCVSTARTLVKAMLLQALTAPLVSVGGTTGSSITFNWTAVSGATGYQVSIDNGQTFTAPSSGSVGLTHSIAGLQFQQAVTIVVRATGAAPCQLSGSSTAVTASAVNQLGNQIFVANAFTPNGDGKNDIVYVRGETIKSVKFYIYDQWGELLYTSFNLQNGWDGTFKGKKEPVGVYVYYLEATMNDGQQVNKKGTITLLR